MSGLLLLFTENETAGTRDSEKFINPNMKSISVNIDGIPNKIYSKGMVPSDFWDFFLNCKILFRSYLKRSIFGGDFEKFKRQETGDEINGCDVSTCVREE